MLSNTKSITFSKLSTDLSTQLKERLLSINLGVWACYCGKPVTSMLNDVVIVEFMGHLFW